MITGRQIREARESLRWSLAEVVRRTKVEPSTIQRAEAADGEPLITFAQAAKIQGAFEQAGVEFLNHGQPSVRLRRPLTE